MRHSFRKINGLPPHIVIRSPDARAARPAPIEYGQASHRARTGGRSLTTRRGAGSDRRTSSLILDGRHDLSVEGSESWARLCAVAAGRRAASRRHRHLRGLSGFGGPTATKAGRPATLFPRGAPSAPVNRRFRFAATSFSIRISAAVTAPTGQPRSRNVGGCRSTRAVGGARAHRSARLNRCSA